MIRVSVEVRSGTAGFCVTVRAESIRQALSIVKARYPGAEAQVVHPIDFETFFVEDRGAPTGLVELETPEGVAG